ncbi:MAG: tRNA lysidine(34) synthetase TilS [Clostridia bacterium]|nr:tRNA lysidine(34) synthetase TilS [Clostridia bacterium]
MREKVIETIKQYAMIALGDTIAVGVSGGKDSIALLHVLYTLHEEYAFSLHAVHVHHGIRAEEADRDERFVKAFCEKYGIECSCFHYDVPQLAKERKISEETCGRELRYAAFESIKADKIATAHTLSDSVETMLFHLVRGSGSRGMCGIPPKRENIIRPLIACSGEDVLAYLKENALEYMTDSTNDDVSYSRNALRLNVIPRLKDINPSFETNAAKTMEVFKEQTAYFENFAARFCKKNGYDAAKIVALEPALRHEVIRYICREEIGTVPEYSHMAAICDILQSGGSVQINSGAVVRVRRGMLEFPGEEKKEAYSFEAKEGKYHLPIGILHIQLLNCKQFENLAYHRFSFTLDYDKINAYPICRNKRTGDAFYDAKRGVSKSMKKYLNEIGFEPEKRSAFPVFCMGQTVIGTLGSTPQKDMAVDGDTKKVLYLYLEEQ